MLFRSFGGGSGPVSTMDKVDYTSDTRTAVPGAALSAARYGLAASSARGNSLPIPATATVTRFSDGTEVPNTGYFGGGGPAPNLYSTMDKVTYATDTTAAVPGAALSIARRYLAATGSSSAGYFGGGQTYSTMDKVTYSTDTTAAVPGAALSIARAFLAATGSSTSGYFGGGGSAPFYSTMDKVDYTSDTRSTVPGAALKIGRAHV